MTPSKGVHVVVSNEKLPKDCVLLLDSHNEDGRTIWSIPWEEGFQILGTTDTEYYRYLDEVMSEKDEIDYILKSVNKGIKGISLTHKDVLGVYAGLRPLNYEQRRKKQSNKLPRDYKIWWQGENMLAISGGKLTSFLSMAEKTIEKIKERTATLGIQKIEIETTKPPKKHPQKAPKKLVNLFKDRYGLLNATRIALLIQEDESRASKIGDINYSIAEIIFFIRYQSAIRIGDLLTRRTMTTHTMKKWNSNLIREIIKIMKTELDWDYEKIVAETKAYRYEWRTMHTWK
jgi:glycerol-3-phosphate dehydrogenase